MNNQEILQKIVAYIEAIMVDKSMTSRDLAEICAKRSGKMSPRTIDKMFKTPSSTTLSTLLKVCDGLDLNLNAVFHSIEIAKTSAENGQQRLVYEIDNPAYNGYTGNYHVFYLPTSAYPEDHADQTLVHGVLKLGDFNSMHECSAILDIDSGDLTTEGSPFSKHYEGTLIYSSNSQMFCRLVCSKYGDMWFMVFNHGNLNNKELACVVGCAATASSGRIRHPAIHRFCLCNMQQYPVIDPDIICCPYLVNIHSISFLYQSTQISRTSNINNWHQILLIFSVRLYFLSPPTSLLEQLSHYFSL